MPRADDQANIYIWADEALELLRAGYGSLATAERVLLRAAKAGRIPWTYEDVDPPGTPVDRMWQNVGESLKPRLAQNEVTFVEVLPPSSGVFGTFPITVGAIKFERAAVEALLPAGAVLPTAETSDAAAPPAATSAERAPSGLPWTIKVELPAPTMTWSLSALQSTEKSVEAATPEPAPPASEPAPTSPSRATETKTAETSSVKAAPKLKLTFKAWLSKVEKKTPRRPREFAVVYAKRLKDTYKDDCRWSVGRMANVLSARKKH